MTTKPPSSSTLPLDTPIETTATVTLTGIRDSAGNLVGENTVTYDSNLTAEGTAAPNTELWLRDGLTRIIEVKSLGSGHWSQEFRLSSLKRYSLSVIEKDPPQDFSYPPKTFTLASDTPIITTVTGKNGPIESGDIYHGYSVEITGSARADEEVEAFNDDVPLNKKVSVDRDGKFKLTLDELEDQTYNLRIKASNDKESDVFVLTVITPLTLDDITDSKGSVVEGDTTFDAKVTISGYARPGKEIQLLNDGVPLANAKATAAVDGYWEVTLDVTRQFYRLAAQALYGSNPVTPVRTFDVEVLASGFEDFAGSRFELSEAGDTHISEGGLKLTLILPGPFAYTATNRENKFIVRAKGKIRIDLVNGISNSLEFEHWSDLNAPPGLITSRVTFYTRDESPVETFNLQSRNTPHSVLSYTAPPEVYISHLEIETVQFLSQFDNMKWETVNTSI